MATSVELIDEMNYQSQHFDYEEDSFDSDDEVDRTKFVIGMRVFRGPFWQWGDQDHFNDQPGGGIIIAICDDSGDGDDLVTVQWDNGQKGNYQIGSHRELSLPSNCDEIIKLLTPGQQVVRGPDWKWRGQDSSSSGTVVELDHTKPGWVVVEWHRSGKTNSYRVGYRGMFDLSAR